jgi:chromosome segregation ATPase
LFIPDPNDADAKENFAYSGDLAAILSSHLLSPLFLEYESSLRQLEREVKTRTLESMRQAEEIKMLVRENEELASRLEVQQREYLKIVEETRDNADLLALRTGSLKNSEASRDGGSVTPG